MRSALLQHFFLPLFFYLLQRQLNPGGADRGSDRDLNLRIGRRIAGQRDVDLVKADEARRQPRIVNAAGRTRTAVQQNLQLRSQQDGRRHRHHLPGLDIGQGAPQTRGIKHHRFAGLRGRLRRDQRSAGMLGYCDISVPDKKAGAVTVSGIVTAGPSAPCRTTSTMALEVVIS